MTHALVNNSLLGISSWLELREVTCKFLRRGRNSWVRIQHITVEQVCLSLDCNCTSFLDQSLLCTWRLQEVYVLSVYVWKTYLIMCGYAHVYSHFLLPLS